ncbi:hypothetical protein JSE7799_00857 [Jannaschia seosinensis]|uniref:DUF2849 domain-containing protein n=1 Tax=Jannaschia seosinensis TaxID=313367 RepID=A0A0M7B8K6_9RHOB|nr:DUF2849 domain-containing protein [Jannaschia seosinensis]CUH29817.1 hypothetical protein JSE7799_00857 [Jannaschia seosinensis]
MSRNRPFTPKVVTANLLREGDVVYLTAAGDWSPDHSAAELLTEAEHANDRLALAEAQPLRVVGAYLADARPGPDGRPEPVHFREGFRATGPSNYAHGKAHEVQ